MRPIAVPPDPSPDEIRRVREYISGMWPRTIRTPADQGPDEIPLPRPFVVPTAGPTFRHFFYWDTFFICEGLLRDGLPELARDCADNMLALIEAQGFMPNFTLRSEANRSQLPLAAELVAAVHARLPSAGWLSGARRALEKEYEFWAALRLAPNGLNRYGHHASPAYLRSAYGWMGRRMADFPDDPVERLRRADHALAECEGWDFTPRYHGRCRDFTPVDLNAVLYGHERHAERFCRLTGEGDPSAWERRSVNRRAAIDALCWDDARGFYFDADWRSGARSDVASAAALFVLWQGAASGEQAARVVHNLALLEGPFGIMPCAPGPRPPGVRYQWDAPNAWPPLQYVAIAGLLRYGFREAAVRIARRYLSVVCRNFATTGRLWEKYNGMSGGIDTADEYTLPPMLGWTAGVFCYACDVLDC